jgi:PLD-like domain
MAQRTARGPPPLQSQSDRSRGRSVSGLHRGDCRYATLWIYLQRAPDASYSSYPSGVAATQRLAVDSQFHQEVSLDVLTIFTPAMVIVRVRLIRVPGKRPFHAHPAIEGRSIRLPPQRDCILALSGVEVRVMLTARASGDPVPGYAGNTYVLDVISAGVRVFMYDKGYLHAKTISIDSEICSIGSSNIDIRSFSINYEINAVLYSRKLAKKLEEAFERDLADCTEFDPAEYQRRNVGLRFRDSAARLLPPLL